jgi:quercetin dioxygenase-like cupin family protein
MLGLTLGEVAARAGCSESMVSRIETANSNPSLTLLRRLAAALDLNVAALFAGEGGDDVVQRAGERPRLADDALRRGDGVVLERIIPHHPAAMLQANVHIVAEGGASDGLIAHAGEEVGYVLDGEVDLTVEGRTWRLRPGDSFHFRSERPHGYRNAGDGQARILWVNTPPTF